MTASVRRDKGSCARITDRSTSRPTASPLHNLCSVFTSSLEHAIPNASSTSLGVSLRAGVSVSRRIARCVRGSNRARNDSSVSPAVVIRGHAGLLQRSGLARSRPRLPNRDDDVSTLRRLRFRRLLWWQARQVPAGSMVSDNHHRALHGRSLTPSDTVLSGSLAALARGRLRHSSSTAAPTFTSSFL